MPITVDHAEDLEHARSALHERRYDAVLTEAELADGNWLDALHLARTVPYETEVIVTDRLADARFWAEILNLGAYDLLPQPFSESEVRRILSNVCTRSLPQNRPFAAA